MKNEGRLLSIILSPYLSEKTTRGSEKNNEHVFRVIADANKYEIKDAVEFIFNTKVKSVRVLNVKAKVKMFRGRPGRKKAWKKAYVALLPDQTLQNLGTP